MKDVEEHRTRRAGRSRGLAEPAAAAMVVVNESGEIVLLNAEAEKQFGYRRGELVGQSVRHVLPCGLAGRALVGRRKDGSEFPIEIASSGLKGAREKFVTATIRGIPPTAPEPRFELFRERRATSRHPMEESLQRALSRQEFEVYYQPKVDLKTGAITGAEALIRWIHPLRGPVPPAQFIPVAEDCGLILPIGNWVLREACTQARSWVDAGLPPATMAVNISAVEFRDQGFLEGVSAVLEKTGLGPRSLELELTESVLMEHADSAASTLQALRDRGVQVSVDDFGTGYSSLSYLRRFPVDALKIDQSFVREITTAPDDATILSTMIALGQSLKLRVVAEGVETEEELDFLRAHQCDEAQGYYFSRPVAPRRFAELLGSGIPESPAPRDRNGSGRGSSAHERSSQ